MKENLCKEIERALHRKMQTPKDFGFLRERIFARQHELVSTTTLKRIWGYLNDGVQPRATTLDILAQFLGYREWEEYCHGNPASELPSSNPVMNRRLSVSESLDRGDLLRLTWQPGRICDIEYMGDLTFRVIASENTRLHKDDTFKCSLIVEGEPLYLDCLQQEGQPPIAYVCGKRTGVMYEYMAR